MQRLHDLLHRYLWIETVNLVEVDVVGLETREGGFDGIEDRRAREAGAVHVVARVGESGVSEGEGPDVGCHGEVDLVEDDDTLSWDVVLRGGIRVRSFVVGT